MVNHLEVKKRIIDLCAYTLEQAGYESKNYAFLLNIAFKHQVHLQKESWQQLLNKFETLNKSNKQLSTTDIVAFAQPIVDEMHKARKDSWAMRLIKSHFYNTLDHIQQNNTQFIAQIGSADHYLSKAIQAHTDYLDKLQLLPLLLEKAAQAAAENKGVTYHPGQTAELLAKTLDSLSNMAFDTTRNTKVSMLTEVLKAGVKIAQPDLPIDDDFAHIITEKLLPIVDAIITQRNEYHAAREDARLSGDDEASLVRLNLLKELGIEFDTLPTIIADTLINPAKDFATKLTATCSSAGIIIPNVVDAFNSDNLTDKITAISTVCGQLDGLWHTFEDDLPSSLAYINDCYQGLKKGTDKVIEGFAYYSLQIMPQVVQYYCGKFDACNAVLAKLGQTTKLPDEVKNTLMAYFAFYHLSHAAELEERDKEILFEVYMQRMMSTEDTYTLSYDYKAYRQLEHQITGKIHLLPPHHSLTKRITNFDNVVDAPLTDSLLSTLEKNAITSAQHLDILLLIDRLAQIEQQFNTHLTKSSALDNIQGTIKGKAGNPELAHQQLIELLLAKNAIEESSHDVHMSFKEHYLIDAEARMIKKYERVRLIPLLETIIDSPQLSAYRYTMRPIYAKLRENIPLKYADYEKITDAIKDKVGFEVYHTELNALLECDIAYELDDIASPTAVNKAIQTPQEEKKTIVRDAALALGPTLLITLEQTVAYLSKQRESCQLLHAASANANIEAIANAKINYINRLIELIEQLRADNGRLIADTINALFDGKPLAEAEKLLSRQLELDNLIGLPGQLTKLAWQVVPCENEKQQSLVNNLLHYCFNDESRLINVITTKNEFDTALNDNPLPSLMTKLSSPLSTTHVNALQDQIANEVFQLLYDSCNQYLGTQGLTYASQLVFNYSRDTLRALFPYPFLADCVIDILSSNTFKQKVMPTVNQLAANATGRSSKWLKEQAKSIIYPYLGIELAKHTEQIAKEFLSLDNLDDAEQKHYDAFALCYLQYRELIKTPKEGNSVSETQKKAAIKCVFSNLLNGNEINSREQVNSIYAKIITWDEKLYSEEIEESAEETFAQQLQFMLDKLDLEDENASNLVCLSCFRQLLEMSLDSMEELDLNNQKASLDIAIKQLNEALLKLQSCGEQYKNYYAAILKDVHQRIVLLQLTAAERHTEDLKIWLSKEINDRQAMGAGDYPVHGMSIFEWQWRESPTIRRLAKGGIFLFETLSYASMLGSSVAIIASTVQLMSGFYALGLTATALASANFIGVAVLGVAFVTRFAFKIGKEIWHHRQQYKQLGELPWYQRIAGGVLLTLKCIGLAFAKTLFSDVLVTKVSSLFAFKFFGKVSEGIQSAVDSFKKFPIKAKVDAEEQALQALERSLEELSSLISQQRAFIKGETDDDKQAQIKDLYDLISAQLQGAQEMIATNKHDARLVCKDYQERLDSYARYYMQLEATLKPLNTLLANRLTEAGEPNDESTSVFTFSITDGEAIADEEEHQITTLSKLDIDDFELVSDKLTIDVEAYDVQRNKQLSKQKPGLLSRFWSLFSKRSEVIDEVDERILEDKEPLPIVTIYDESIFNNIALDRSYRATSANDFLYSLTSSQIEPDVNMSYRLQSEISVSKQGMFATKSRSKHDNVKFTENMEYNNERKIYV